MLSGAVRHHHPAHRGLLTNPDYVVSGPERAKGVVVTRHATACQTWAAGHTDSPASAAADRTHRNGQKALFQHSHRWRTAKARSILIITGFVGGRARMKFPSYAQRVTCDYELGAWTEYAAFKDRLACENSLGRPIILYYR